MPPLNNVTFQTVPGGLGRLPAGDDHVSAILMGLTSSPAAWTADAVGKKYVSLDEAEADLIIDGDANYGLLWYFIREYFRISGPSELWVINSTHANFNNQKFYSLTEGRVHQAYWYKATNFAGIAAEVATQEAFAAAQEALFAPLVMLISVKDEVTTIGGTEADLRALTSETVSVIIAGDNSAKGKEIATSLSVKYVPAAAAILGALSRAQVHMNIGWVANFNLADDELQRVKLADGTDIESVAASLQDTLNTRGYIFLRKHLGIAGTYVNDSHTAIAVTSDFAYIENVRTIQKAKRLIRTGLLPDLNGPLSVDDAGKLPPDQTRYFETRVARPLTLMQNVGELSGFTVFVDPEQDVLATSQLTIQVKLQPRGVSRQIKVTIGFAVNLT